MIQRQIHEVAEPSRSRSLLCLILMVGMACTHLAAAETLLPKAIAESLQQAYLAEVQGDDATAAELFEELAQAGSVDALFSLGCFYRDGRQFAPDAGAAFQRFHAAALRGHVLAMHEVGVAYLEGLGVEKNPDLAWQWLFNAAQRHGPSAWRLFLVARNDEEARQWLQRAATMGVPEAMRELSDALAHGKYGFQIDTNQSDFWHQEVAKAALDQAD